MLVTLAQASQCQQYLKKAPKESLRGDTFCKATATSYCFRKKRINGLDADKMQIAKKVVTM